jgi:hypothetical protein
MSNAKFEDLDTTIKFGGRMLRITAYVNSDEDPDVVGARLRDAARGPEGHMALVVIAVTPPSSKAQEIWRGLLKVVHRRSEAS